MYAGSGYDSLTIAIMVMTTSFLLRVNLLAIVNESYPEPGYIKDGNSDYQVQKPVIWTKEMGDIEDVKDKLVDRMESNDFDL